jgi:hypothetical protein
MTITAVDVAHDDDLTFRLQENNTPVLAAIIKANPSGLGIYVLFTAFVGACQFMGLDPYDEFLALLEVYDGAPTGAYTNAIN